MGAAIAFSVTLSALCGFLALKHWELRRGRVLISKFRAKADALVLHYAKRLFALAPNPRPDLAKHLLREAAHSLTILLLRGLHFLERRLLKVVNMIKGRGTPARNDSVSEFLRSVSESKQKSPRGYINE
ncbi:hypothetical protein A3D66_00795 [Candidatus Kaiserbacteria bacterium RIFCSPHIGHO2_02_FULL_50_9]|uniref:Uncharacterized protein n=1 Tax=Candidatus Kaiserbacteria bacterium RIFCSPLOWO2_01_FULL_51_21 TaxID=1798508 RepID=A0A1F6ECY2_9BACT|nr:MAG: hypothetical protein A2761_00645 [Candidatus Kaiserbacteria bacterium RIFCSPHIGHO2_01_FULL_51_33]OGG63551.1 MAG: hypothetical protein A3D66_00795 [Candidatus Kaiserbacteria bacterium RIFCSPHIGHO2_02_FULL_50_9]OGG71534.1 MAG: hypothetical protein A3A35_03010 [Candidatus Kaiserbacteria bacterium RIFCSPLOWO2_01_FULL_51_21]